MKWYAAHALFYFEIAEASQNSFLVWENVYLILADSFDGAKRLAEDRAKKDESDPESPLELDGNPAHLRFASIRKIVECQDLDITTNSPAHGTEITYSEFELFDQSEFDKLIGGKTALLRYCGGNDSVTF